MLGDNTDSPANAKTEPISCLIFDDVIALVDKEPVTSAK